MRAIDKSQLTQEKNLQKYNKIVAALKSGEFEQIANLWPWTYEQTVRFFSEQVGNQIIGLILRVDHRMPELTLARLKQTMDELEQGKIWLPAKEMAALGDAKSDQTNDAQTLENTKLLAALTPEQVTEELTTRILGQIGLKQDHVIGGCAIKASKFSVQIKDIVDTMQTVSVNHYANADSYQMIYDHAHSSRYRLVRWLLKDASENQTKEAAKGLTDPKNPLEVRAAAIWALLNTLTKQTGSANKAANYLQEFGHASMDALLTTNHRKVTPKDLNDLIKVIETYPLVISTQSDQEIKQSFQILTELIRRAKAQQRVLQKEAEQNPEFEASFIHKRLLEYDFNTNASLLMSLCFLRVSGNAKKELIADQFNSLITNLTNADNSRINRFVNSAGYPKQRSRGSLKTRS